MLNIWTLKYSKLNLAWTNSFTNKRPAGRYNPPPRPRDRNFTGCILPWSLTFCSTIMIHLSRLLCILQILKSMLVASQHFFSLSKLPLRGYIYIYPSMKPYISFYSIYWTGTYPMEFLFQGFMLLIDLMPYQCWISLVDFNFMCFSLAKKPIFYPEKWPIFRALRRNRWLYTVETMTHFASPVHVSKTLLKIIICLPSCIYANLDRMNIIFWIRKI